MSQLSSKVLEVSIPYLGPAAKIFLERQTIRHLKHLQFDDLKKENLPELAFWVNASGSLIIEPKKSEELSKKILSLN